MKRFKVVGLLSGGKDSCYNLCHCVAAGHEVVALATLHPPASTDELDSYMYQTVGHDAVHLVAAAMGLPLYRREIKGTAVNQQSEYGARLPSSSKRPELDSADETEDLYQLLLSVKAAHPDVDAVSVGAILSNYQRVRVEHVALRPELNLLPLTYLWNRSQHELLAEMIQSGLTSILIKVAGIGLDESHLGKTLHQMQPRLLKLNSMYGAHVCGEGGEYETLTLDSPLFKKRIQINQTETVIHSDAAFASVSYLRIKSAELVEKQEDDKISLDQLPVPDDLDDSGKATLEAVQQALQQFPKAATDSVASVNEKLPHASISARDSKLTAGLTRRGPWFSISNIDGVRDDKPDATLEEQVVCAFKRIQDLLQDVQDGLDLSYVSHMNLYLSDQGLFGSINSIYRRFFGSGPPTRACVGVPLGAGAGTGAFRISCVGHVDLLGRRALHVQGRSFWAPANIGPYSQAVAVGGRVFIAGQIGLRPVDLSLPSDAGAQTALALQHARRVADAATAPVGTDMEGGVCWLDAIHPAVAHAAFGESNAAPIVYASLPPASLPRNARIEWQFTAKVQSVVNDDDDDNASVDRTTLVIATPLTRSNMTLDPANAFMRTLLYSSSQLTRARALEAAQTQLGLSPEHDVTLVPVSQLHVPVDSALAEVPFALLWHGD